MKQIKRPDIECASSKVNARGCLGFNDHECPLCGFWRAVSRASLAGIDPEAQEEMTVIKDKLTPGRAQVSTCPCCRRRGCEPSAAGPRLSSLEQAPGLARSSGGTAPHTFRR